LSGKGLQKFIAARTMAVTGDRERLAPASIEKAVICLVITAAVIIQ
jgi:hypothetical protein